jgi:MFS family permease
MKQLLRNKNYTLLLLGYMLSVFVDAIVFMVAVKQIEVLGNHTASYTTLYLSNYLPAVLFSLAIGAWINSKQIVPVMRNSLLIRAILLVIFIGVGGLSNLYLIYLFIFIDSFLTVFILPSTDTLVTKIVPIESRSDANAIIKLMLVLMQMIGYGITTVLIKLNITLITILIVSSILLLISFFAISKIKYQQVKTTHVQRVGSELRDLFFYLKEQKHVTKLFSLFALAWLVASSIDLIVIAYLTDSAKVSSENFGVVAIVVFLGMIIGSSFSSILYVKYKSQINIIFGFPLLVYTGTVASMYVFDNWFWILPFFFLGGISLGLYEVCFTTYLQDNNDEEYYTRIFSIQGMILNSMPLPGLLFLGVLIELIGIQYTIITISLFLFVLAIVALNMNFTNQSVRDKGTGSVLR